MTHTNEGLRKALALSATIVALAACGGGDAPASDAEAATPAGETAAHAAAPEVARRYGVRSGIVRATTNAIGTGNVETYFDEWGAREAIYTTMEVEVFGVTSTTRSVEILADGWRTQYDPDAKTGKRWREVVAAGAGSQIPDISAFTDAQRLEYGYEELEPREYFGRQVPGFAMDMAGMKIRAWVWENIAFRSEMDMGGDAPMVTEVIEFQEGVPVPADRFEVPADVAITEVQIG